MARKSVRSSCRAEEAAKLASEQPASELRRAALARGDGEPLQS